MKIIMPTIIQVLMKSYIFFALTKEKYIIIYFVVIGNYKIILYLFVLFLLWLTNKNKLSVYKS